MASEFVAVGAIVGSLIAAWFRRSARWLIQVVSGSWIGYVSGHWLIDFMGWAVTPDYLLMAGTLTGCLGYSALELVLSPDVRKALKSRAASIIGKGNLSGESE